MAVLAASATPDQVWRLIAAQDATDECQFSLESRLSFLQNPDNPTSPCYMAVGNQPWDSLRNRDGSFVFMLNWTVVDGLVQQSLVWSQTSDPKQAQILGFQPMNLAAVIAATNWDNKAEAAFRGLQRSQSSSCVLDGTGWPQVSAYNCVGALEILHGGISATRRRTAWKQELFVQEVAIGGSNDLASTWRLLVRQDVRKCLFDSSTKTSLLANEINSKSDCYMALGNQAWDTLQQLDGTFHFRLLWFFGNATVDEVEVVEWAQKASPVEPTALGFVPLNNAAISASAYWGAGEGLFVGLGQSEPDMPCVLDGNGGFKNYFNCVGSSTRWPLNLTGMGLPPVTGSSCGGQRTSVVVGLELLVLEPAGRWQLLAKQTNACLFDNGSKTSFLFNEADPDAECYMIVGDQNWTALRGSDDFLTFQTKWRFADGSNKTFLWRQTSPPTSQLIEGFQPLNEQALRATYIHSADCGWTQADYVFGGLGQSYGGTCVLDGSGSLPGTGNCVGFVGRTRPTHCDSMNPCWEINAANFQVARTMQLYVLVPAQRHDDPQTSRLMLALVLSTAAAVLVLVIVTILLLWRRLQGRKASALPKDFEKRLEQLQMATERHKERAAATAQQSNLKGLLQARYHTFAATRDEEKASRLVATAALQVAGGPEYWGISVAQIFHFYEEHHAELNAYCDSHYLGDDFAHVCASDPCPHDHGCASHRQLCQEDKDKLKMILNMHVLVNVIIKPITKAFNGVFGYATSLNRDKPLKSELFISHCWSAPFPHLLAALRTRPRDTVVWICSFALPQNLDIDKLLHVPVHQSPFARALQMCEELMLALDADVQALSRSWCCFELHMAFTQMKAVEIRGPSSNLECYSKLLLKAQSIDIRCCEATRASDHSKIMNAIRGGEALVNMRIRKLLASTAALIASVEQPEDAGLSL